MFSSPPGQGTGSLFLKAPTAPGLCPAIRNSGSLTAAIHSLKAGDIIGLRGPYGRGFPMDRLLGKNLLFVAGGIGMAPLRGVIEYCLAHRSDYGRITILYGSKTPDELSFQQDFGRWQEDAQLELTVDRGNDSWQGRVGLVTALLPEQQADKDDMALVCGPGIMIRFVIEGLEARGYTPNNIITTLERHMKCGIGICGHCHFEDKLICTDGPVSTRAELDNLTHL